MIQLKQPKWWRTIRNLDKVEKLENEVITTRQKLKGVREVFYWKEFTKREPQDIQSFAQHTVSNYPQFIEFLKTRIVGVRNELAKEHVLEKNKRFILLGQQKELNELLEILEHLTR
jgi:flagellar biosynthesis chaperone FliJ